MAKIFLSSSNLPSSACERQCILANWLKPFSFEFGDFTAVKSAKIHPHTTTFPKPLSSSPSSHEQHSFEENQQESQQKWPPFPVVGGLKLIGSNRRGPGLRRYNFVITWGQAELILFRLQWKEFMRACFWYWHSGRPIRMVDVRNTAILLQCIDWQHSCCGTSLRHFWTYSPYSRNISGISHTVFLSASNVAPVHGENCAEILSCIQPYQSSEYVNFNPIRTGSSFRYLLDFVLVSLVLVNGEEGPYGFLLHRQYVMFARL